MKDIQKTLLVVDDEGPIRTMLDTVLTLAGYRVMLAENVRSADRILADEQPHLILLDWMLPAVSGVDYARRLRRSELTKRIPIVMLTARDGEEDVIRGLKTGADDYVTKPFSTKELLARVEAIIRRTHGETSQQSLEIGPLRLDSVEHRVYADEATIDLGPKEFRLLQFLMSNPERLYTRAQILDHVWGSNVYVEERTVDVHIRRLRKALAGHNCDHLVQTVRGAGYRLSQRD
jgi:two-component system phosphate regulon response regulator PhoB